MGSEIILQIFSGGFLSQHGKPASHGKLSRGKISFEEVERKLNSVLPRFPVRAVIMGWATDRALYEKTAAYLAKRNVDFYLWLPVFSETGSIRPQSGLTDFLGRRLEGGGGEEDFAFCCPNDPRSLENVIDIFEREFAAIPFNGVFLDKIRYPSFAQGQGSGEGFGSVFSCFCPHCLAAYREENFDVEELKNALSRPVPMGILAYRGSGNYEFEDPCVSRFFSLKASFIRRGLERLCGFFREKGYGIGFDVFAPFLSPFVGQDLASEGGAPLSGLCDFMKPMMYRATQAPAGLPFETEKLMAETVGSDVTKRRAFYGTLGLDREKKPFDLTFAAKELKELVAASACPVYAGVEINRKERLAEVYPDYIEETIAAYQRTGVRGLALSWNLLDAPEENIARAAEVIGKGGA